MSPYSEESLPTLLASATGPAFTGSPPSQAARVDILPGDRVVELNGTPLADVENAPASILKKEFEGLNAACCGLRNAHDPSKAKMGNNGINKNVLLM